MPFKNKHRINFYNNPYKQKSELLDDKNKLESFWYDEEARGLLGQLKCLPGLMPIDQDFEGWFAGFYNRTDDSCPFDRDYVFFKAFGNVKGKRILELGSGNGCLSRFLIRRGAIVCSIDLSGLYGRILAQSENRSLPVRCCAEILPFKSESFDIVTSFVALHHFNLEMSLGELKRVLKPDGKGIFMEPLLDSKMLYYLRQLVPVADNESPGGGGLRTDALRQSLDRLKMAYSIKEYELVTRLERIGFISGLQVPLRKLDHFIFNALPFLRKLARTAVIEIWRQPVGI